jgi:glutaredoxin
MPALTIYSRPGCHLCDAMKHLVRRVTERMTIPIAIEEIDISGNPDLEARYGEEVPVLLVDGRKIAKYRISESELTRAVTARAGEAGGAG